MTPPASITSFEDFIDALVLDVIDRPAVRALWLEAEDPRALRRPYPRSPAPRLHAVADEPDYPALLELIPALLAARIGLESPRWQDTPRNARQLEVGLAFPGAPPLALTCVLECSAFLAKRPRRAVKALVDKTCHLTHVMDFGRK